MIVVVLVVVVTATAAMSLSTITTLLLFNSISPGQTTSTSTSLSGATPGEPSVVWRNRTIVDRCFSDRHDCDLHLECVRTKTFYLESCALLLPISMTALIVANIKHMIAVTVTWTGNKYGQVYVLHGPYDPCDI